MGKNKLKKATCSLDNIKHSDITCYDLSFLKLMRQKIESQLNTNIPDSNSLQELYSNIEKTVSNKVKCKNESCLLEITGYQDYYSKFFAPIAPEEWKRKKITYLNTLHIEEVCKKISNVYPQFTYLGTTPINFAYNDGNGFIHEDVASVDIDQLQKQKKTSFGVVFNTDPHYKEGEHWISLFVSIDKKRIYYYDSYGELPGPEVKEYIDNLRSQMGRNTKVFYNNVIQQKKGSECGMYCIVFLVNMAKTNGDFDYTVRTMPNDDELNKKRVEFFNMILG